MKTVFVTGASGFIGLHAIHYLIQSGYEVHAVSTKPPNEKRSGIIWHQCDLLDTNKTTHLINKIRPSHLLHFAWVTQPGKYWTSLENFLWIQASLNLLQTFYKLNGIRVVMAGTCAEYDWNFETLSEDSTPCNPSTVYGNCKHAMQTLLAEFSRKTGLSSAWGRVFFLYGPNEHPQRLTPTVIRSLLKEEPVLCTEGNQLRDFLNVNDVAKAFVTLLESSVQGPINIASGEPVALKDFILKIGKKMGRPDLIQLGKLSMASDEPAKLIADTKKLKKELGWIKEIDLNFGIDQVIKWWKSHLDCNSKNSPS